jgi:hypothetical protein
MIKLTDILEEGTRCWKGYEKKGTKMMFGKRVPNCVKRENVAPDPDGKAAPFGSGFDEIEEDLRKWVKQKWVDISRKKKGGGHPACGASAKKKSRKGGKRAYPKCVPASKAASMSKKDKESAVRRKRAVYKNKSKGGKPPKKAKNVSTKAESLAYYKQKLIEVLEEKAKKAKRDKCYYKVKGRYKVWPSAYASLALSACRQVGAANWGEGGKKKDTKSARKRRSKAYSRTKK